MENEQVQEPHSERLKSPSNLQKKASKNNNPIDDAMKEFGKVHLFIRSKWKCRSPK